MHLVVDGFGGDPDKLKDVDLVNRFLDDYPSAIGMRKIAEPQVYSYHGRKAEDWGVSGFVLIAESHISVHTFPDRRYMNIDVFSCKPFDVTASLDELKTTFSLPEVQVWTLERGLEFTTPRTAYQGMVGERVNIIAARRSVDA